MRLMPLDVMMPLTEGLTFSPPASDAAQSDGSFNPYGEVVHIASVVEEVTVLGSLQKPKKVWPPQTSKKSCWGLACPAAALWDLPAT